MKLLHNQLKFQNQLVALEYLVAILEQNNPTLEEQMDHPMESFQC
jgi:hypothetical protein